MSQLTAPRLLALGIVAFVGLFMAGVLGQTTGLAMDLLLMLSLVVVLFAAVLSGAPLFNRSAAAPASGLSRAGRFAALAIAVASALVLLGQVSTHLFPFENDWGLVGTLAALSAGSVLAVRLAASDQPLTRQRIAAREILLVTAISLTTAIVLPVADVDLRWGTFLAVAGGAYWTRWVVWALREYRR